MKKKFRIGLLTTVESPLLPFFIDRILIEKLNDIVVICDSKTISDKDKKIWLERTSGAFDLGKYKKINIYKFDAEKIPFYFVKNHNHKNSIQLVKSLKLDVLLNAGTPRKLSKNVLKSTRHGVINVHPGLLPEYRGCSAVEWAIYNDKKVGNTTHFMTEEYDEGPIIKSESYNFLPDDDYKSIDHTDPIYDGVQGLWCGHHGLMPHKKMELECNYFIGSNFSGNDLSFNPDPRRVYPEVAREIKRRPAWNSPSNLSPESLVALVKNAS